MTNKLIFESWKNACNVSALKLTDAWDSRKDYTNEVLYDDDAVIFNMADLLGLKVIGEYYSTDAIFFKDEDLVDNASAHNIWTSVKGNWLKHFRIAFEHENTIDGNSGGYQEICHLLTVKADFKVLVGYNGSHTSDEYANDFQSIIAASVGKDNILLILGSFIAPGYIHWDGYEITESKITQL